MMVSVDFTVTLSGFLTVTSTLFGELASTFTPILTCVLVIVGEPVAVMPVPNVTVAPVWNPVPVIVSVVAAP